MVRATLRASTAANGLTGKHLGRKFGFEQSTRDIGAVLGDPQIDTVVIATRHDSHAGYVVDALKAGKHVFVEKPLAIRLEEIEAVGEAVRTAGASGRVAPLLLGGVNHRLAPHVVKTKATLQTVREPKTF